MAEPRQVGESYRDACARLYGQCRAAEIDRDRAEARVAVLQRERDNAWAALLAAAVLPGLDGAATEWVGAEIRRLIPND